MLRLLLALFLIIFTTPAFAQTATLKTIEVPKALVWVTTAGTPVMPATTPAMYFDAVGFWWMVTPPVNAASPDVTGAFAYKLYESAGCLGRALLVMDPRVHPGAFITARQVIAPGGGQFYSYMESAPMVVGATVTYVLVGGVCQPCTPVTGGPMWDFATLVSLTPPTLPAGPYHVEYR
jgi:hypothetical protein